MARKGLAAGLAGAATVGAGLVAQRVAVARRRRNDPEANEPFGQRRGERSQMLKLIDGAKLFIEEVGPADSKRAAVFLHGSALRTDSWYYQLDGIGGHRLVFYDLRGHGVSQPRGEKPFTMKTLAEDLLEVVEACDLEEIVIVGHSIGGMIALELCNLRPDLMDSLVKGLVLSNTTYRPAVETLAGGAAISHLERVTRRPFDNLGVHHQRLDRLRRIIKPSDAIFMMVSFAAFGPKASAKQIDFTYDMLAETPTDILFDLIRSYRDFDVRDVLPDITVPALVIGGDHDRLTVMDASEHLAEHLPKAELVMLEDCGHMTMLERHERFNDLMERFLNDHLGRPRVGVKSGARRLGDAQNGPRRLGDAQNGPRRLGDAQNER